MVVIAKRYWKTSVFLGYDYRPLARNVTAPKGPEKGKEGELMNIFTKLATVWSYIQTFGFDNDKFLNWLATNDGRVALNNLGNAYKATLDKASAILNFVATTVTSFTTRPGDTVGEFFKTRQGLYVWDSFRTMFGQHWMDSSIQTIPPTNITYHDLAKPATDFDIQKEFEQNKTPFIFENIGVFLAVLAGLLLAQWNNEQDGPLLTNGKANLFYVRIGTEVIVVRVGWYSGGRKWRVDAYRRVVVRWDDGRRVFHRDS